MKRYDKRLHPNLLILACAGLLSLASCAPPASLPTNVDTKPTPGEDPGDGGDTGSDPGGDTGSDPGSGSGDEGGGDPGTTSSHPDFTVNIDATGNGGGYNLVLGFSPTATDGYDSAVDTYAPPPPPQGVFDSALVWNGDRYYKQVVEGSVQDLVEHTWSIPLQYPMPNQTITLSWDPTGWSNLGVFRLKDPFGGSLIDIDMATLTPALVDPTLGTLDTSDPIRTELTLTHTAMGTLNVHVTPFERTP